MSRDEVFENVKGIIIDFFDDDEIEITEKTVAADVDGWDSLAHISILSALEDRFRIQFNVEDAQHIKCVGDIVDIILSKKCIYV